MKIYKVTSTRMLDDGTTETQTLRLIHQRLAEDCAVKQSRKGFLVSIEVHDVLAHIENNGVLDE